MDVTGRIGRGAAMTIKVPVNLKPAEQAALAARADAEGVSVESLLHEAVLYLIGAGKGETHTALAPDQWERELLEWLDSMPDMPRLSDAAIGRENIYTCEDEWRGSSSSTLPGPLAECEPASQI